MKAELIQFISRFEGCRLEMYLDVAGRKTIGYGHLILSTDNIPDSISLEAAQNLLWYDLAKAMNAVRDIITVGLTDNQFIALTDFCYNLGPSCLQRSQLRLRLNRGDYLGAANAFPLYNHAAGHVFAGLTRRRNAEKKLFLTQEEEENAQTD